MSTVLDVTAEPQDTGAEEQLLGSLLTLGQIGAVSAETHLAAEDFYRDANGTIYRAIQALAERGMGIDAVTVADELRLRGTLEEAGGASRLAELEVGTRAPGNAIHHAKIVSECSLWRRRLRASRDLQVAALGRDSAGYDQAMQALGEQATPPDAFYGADRQRDLVYELMEGRGKADFVWPFSKLNTLQSGGMRRGQLVIVSGYTNEGKSHFADQLLDTNRKHGARVCLYDNEMSPQERAARRVTRMTGIPYGRLLDGKLEEHQREKALGYLNQGEFWPIVDTAGWSAEEIASHIRHHRWDLAVVDILHNIPFADERELSASVASLKAAAKLAGCCIVLVCHVNRGGVERGKRRRPVRSDLRWSGDIENLADVVCFVYREQDETTLEATEDAWVYFDKCRGGRLGAEKARFNPLRLRFELR